MASTDSGLPSPLFRALKAYVDTRSAAIIEARKSLKIGELDARALLFIADNPGTRPTALRGYLGITSAGVSTLIDRLVSRDAVRREVDQLDRRVSRLFVAVDLTTVPWSALVRFDTDFEAAVGRHDAGETATAARLITLLTGQIAG